MISGGSPTIYVGDLNRAIEFYTAALEAIGKVYSEKMNWRPLESSDQVDHVLLVASWFRQRVEEKLKTLSPDQAVGVCAEPESLAARSA